MQFFEVERPPTRKPAHFVYNIRTERKQNERMLHQTAGLERGNSLCCMFGKEKGNSMVYSKQERERERDLKIYVWAWQAWPLNLRVGGVCKKRKKEREIMVLEPKFGSLSFMLT